MRRALTILFAVIAVTCIAPPVASQGEYDGLVTVDSAAARPSESVAVAVWLRNNDLPVSAMTIPLKFSSADLILDSVSFNGTVWGIDFSGYSIIDNSARTVRITVLPNDIEYPLPAANFSDGVVAYMYFTVGSVALPQLVTIDSVYIDSILAGDIHLYTRIDLADNTGRGVYLPGFVGGDVEVLAATGVDDDDLSTGLPTDYALGQNYPNPFNPTTVISYSLPRAGLVRLEVFNILGQQVATLFAGHREAGTFTIEFDGSKQPSGIYFYRLRHDAGIETRKMMLLK